MRWFALILCLMLPSWGWAEPERMICASVADHILENGKLKTLEVTDKKLFIAIDGDILAINNEDSSAHIFRQKHAASRDLLGTINRKFVNMSDVSIDVIVVDGKEC